MVRKIIPCLSKDIKLREGRVTAYRLCDLALGAFNAHSPTNRYFAKEGHCSSREWPKQAMPS